MHKALSRGNSRAETEDCKIPFLSFAAKNGVYTPGGGGYTPGVYNQALEYFKNFETKHIDEMTGNDGIWTPKSNNTTNHIRTVKTGRQPPGVVSKCGGLFVSVS